MMRSRTVGTVQRVHGVRVVQLIDLTEHLTIDEFDAVVTAMEGIIGRGKQCDRLLFALGGVVDARGARARRRR